MSVYIALVVVWGAAVVRAIAVLEPRGCSEMTFSRSNSLVLTGREKASLGNHGFLSVKLKSFTWDHTARFNLGLVNYVLDLVDGHGSPITVV